ncbi:glycoside hydrolase family 2 protein [Amniculicola lignicola CBS 123094]|uniref:Glycoside hydrolase family 2 protein n=1 Tax=Amniculicola lignicola CBS 123094 TaxID=1392246 RepID=A0A6A5WX96_9PLEO|nr:glycoside hydrolase family 2 protein [Amniculicola lignicola CBS 123094]
MSPKASSEEPYPRPDFVRSKQNWKSLNGAWDFLFDDEDIGVTSRWHSQKLPREVAVKGSSASNLVSDSQSETITAKIAANPENLTHGNLSQREREAATNIKQKIEVPFAFQTLASGINERGVHEVLWYQRSIDDIRTTEQKSKGYRLITRFGAVDYEATIWLNGVYVGSHRGGHVPFDVDITDAIEICMDSDVGQHRLTVRVYDSAYDLTQPRGKQYWGAKSESIFYTPSGGIWQNVWLESVPSARLADSSHGTILRSDDVDSGLLHATIRVLGRKTGQKYSVQIEGSYGEIAVSKSEKKYLPKDLDYLHLDLDLRLSSEQQSEVPESALLASLNNFRGWRDGLALWSPEFPQLYTLTMRLFGFTDTLIDEVNTTTGMRSLDWSSGTSMFKLNGQPLFQALCLDQGYWPNTGMTPPSQSSLKADIEMAKAMGFNGCRKHQKVEDPVFLYWADRLGYLVWGEMANAYNFSNEYVDRFNQEWIEAVKRDLNHPCIVTWTPVNESWAYTNLKGSVEQRNHIRALYFMTKTLDPSRPINDNCGWEHVKTDLTTFHDYADSDALSNTCAILKGGILGPKAGRPMFVEPIPGRDDGGSHVEGAVVICTEFGGVNIAPATDANHKGEWGYTTAADSNDLLKRVEKLVAAVVDGKHCSGFVWTQLADIEQETNGLYTFDRKEKLDASKVRAVIANAQQRYYSMIKQCRANV